MSQLPGTINHFCFWPLHCSRIVPPSPSKWRLDPRMTKNGFKWGCAQAILSVLIALAADLHTNKPWQGQHKFWKYVSPIRTYFAWLPEHLARTYCRAALDRRSGLPYGGVHHLQGSESDFRHSMVFQNIYHIGDTKSAQELRCFFACPGKGWGCAVESNVLTVYILMDLASAGNSSQQLSNC